MDITTSIGVIGASTILTGFVLNQFGVLPVKSRMYDCLNIIGPTILIIYAVLLDSLPFIVLNVVWTASSSYSLYKSFRQKEAQIT